MPHNIFAQLHSPSQRKHHCPLLNAQEAAFCQGTGRRRAGRLSGYGILANKIPVAQYVESCFLSGLRFDVEFYLSFLNDKQGIGRITPTIDCLSFPKKAVVLPAPTVERKVFGSKESFCLAIGRPGTLSLSTSTMTKDGLYAHPEEFSPLAPLGKL
jgi:hypothetical protein